MLKTQALLLESVSSMRLWRTLSFCVSKCFEHVLKVDIRASVFSRVFSFALVFETDFRVSKVYTSFAYIVV